MRTHNLKTNQKAAKRNFDLKGKTYEVIISILLAKCFNHVMCFDAPPSPPKGKHPLRVFFLLEVR